MRPNLKGNKTLQLCFLKLQLNETVNKDQEALSSNMGGQHCFPFTKRLEKQDLSRNQQMMKPTLSLETINIR